MLWVSAPEARAVVSISRWTQHEAVSLVAHERQGANRERAVPMLCYRSKASAGVPGASIAVAHRFRHSAATELFDAGVVARAALQRSAMLQRRQQYSTRIFHEWRNQCGQGGVI
jgi:integrase